MIFYSYPNSGLCLKNGFKENNMDSKFANISDAKLCTTISNEFGVKVSTPCGCILGFGLDNAIVELDLKKYQY